MSKDSEPKSHKPATENPKTSLIYKWRQKLRGQPGSFGSPARVLSTAILVFLGSQVIAALIVSFGWVFSGHSADDLSFDKSAWWQFVYILLVEVLAVWLVWWIIKRRQLKWADIGLGRRPKWTDLKWTIGGFLVFYGLIIILAI